MATAHNLTTKRDIVQPLSWFGEGDRITTPALFGVDVVDSTFNLVDNCTEINPGVDIIHEDILSFGKVSRISAVKLREDYTFGFKFNPADTDLFVYIYDDTAEEGTGGAGSPDETLSFHWSERINGTTHHFNVLGWSPTNLNLTIERGLWQCEMIGVCKEITRMNTVDPFETGGTPVYPALGTDSAALEHSSVSTTPFTYDGVNYAERRFTMNITRGMAIQAVNGSQQIIYTKPSSKEINFSADVFTGTNTADVTELANDWYLKDATAIAKDASYKFTTAPAKTFTFTNCVLTSYEKSMALGSTDASIESVAFNAESTTDL